MVASLLARNVLWNEVVLVFVKSESVFVIVIVAVTGQDPDVHPLHSDANRILWWSA